MAKWGEGDPRWIVEERPDATNVNNWHWYGEKSVYIVQINGISKNVFGLGRKKMLPNGLEIKLRNSLKDWKLRTRLVSFSNGPKEILANLTLFFYF